MKTRKIMRDIMQDDKDIMKEESQEVNLNNPSERMLYVGMLGGGQVLIKKFNEDNLRVNTDMGYLLGMMALESGKELKMRRLIAQATYAMDDKARENFKTSMIATLQEYKRQLMKGGL